MKYLFSILCIVVISGCSTNNEVIDATVEGASTGAEKADYDFSNVTEWKTYTNAEYDFSFMYPAMTKYCTQPFDDSVSQNEECVSVETKEVSGYKAKKENDEMLVVAFGSGVPNQDVDFEIIVYNLNVGKYSGRPFPQFNESKLIRSVSDEVYNSVFKNRISTKVDDLQDFSHVEFFVGHKSNTMTVSFTSNESVDDLRNQTIIESFVLLD